MIQPSAAALAPVPEPTPWWWPIFVVGLTLLSLLPVGLMVAPGIMKVPRYDVVDGKIVVRSIASQTVIPAGTPVEKTFLALGSKISGSNGEGYTVGRFHSAKGELAVYSNTTRPTTGLLFATQPPTWLTPSDPEGLLTAWRQGRTATFHPAPVSPVQTYFFLFMTLPGLLLVAGLLFWKPRIAYQLQGENLIVKSRLSTTTFPRRGTKASLTTDSLGAKGFGTNMPGYYTGTFKTRSGPVQAAASTARPAQALVLEHAGHGYYLTPSDPAAVAAWFTG